MMDLNIPVGVSDFEQIRKNGYYYIDKSGMIREILKNESTAVTLITRPRRFGKTLGMSMLASFFDMQRDSRDVFKDLEICSDELLCGRWMNKYPVIFLSFKDIGGLNFQSAYEMLAMVITELYRKHLYLMESDRINRYDKASIGRIMEGAASVAEIKGSLALLIKSMSSYFGKPVIFLLDEYDVPVAKASRRGYYDEMMDVIRPMLSMALKDNSLLKFAVLTGCLKIAKESIFTGTNNLVSDTIISTRLNEYFGFTDNDIHRILTDAESEEKADVIKKWYDGYRFGNTDVYCPWDVMNYMRDLKADRGARPKSYWKNTSDNSIIRSFIDYAGNSITEKLEALISGGYIIQRIEEDLTYDMLHSSEENLWSVLYFTGYLTRARENELSGPIPDGASALRIPNAEIREIFENSVRSWFTDRASLLDRKALFNAVWNGDSATLTKEMNDLLRMTISYHDYKEDFYHAFLAGIFAGAGYMVESNREHGEGRSDIAVVDPRGGRAAIFEAKYSSNTDDLDRDCDRALAQIKDRMYAEEFFDKYDSVICFGIAFFKKRCRVKAAAARQLN